MLIRDLDYKLHYQFYYCSMSISDRRLKSFQIKISIPLKICHVFKFNYKL